MHYRILGKTGLKVSLASFGTGGPSSFGQTAGLPEEQQAALVRRCLDLGINLFDTSARYGRSEELLGRALRGIPRETYYLSTKWGAAATWSQPGVGGEDGPVNKDPHALTEGVTQSLQRLGTDYLDILHFHGLRTEQYDEVVDRFGPMVQRLQEQGRIRFIGFSERFIADPAHTAALRGLQTHPEFWDVLMLKYGILNQMAAAEVLPLAQEHQVGIMNMAPVRLILPDPTKLETKIAEWKANGLIGADDVPDRDPLDWLAHDDVPSVIAAGYRFAAAHPAISTVITGTANITHLEENVAALEQPNLPESDQQRLIRTFGSIAEYA